MTGAATIDIAGLRIETVRQGRTVALVEDADLRLERGRVLALVGNSGSGKSLTCLGLQDLLPPGARRAAGEIRVDGAAMAPRSLPGRIVATVMQGPRSAFNPVRSMRAHGRETLAAAGPMAGPRDARIAATFAEVGLEPDTGVLDLFPFQMSGGMLQRAMIALALLADAPFLIADEPTTDLDLVAQAQILDLLDRLIASRGLGVLLVTHDMSVVARLADDVAVMDAGRIVERGAAETVFRAPRHPSTGALLAAHFALYPAIAEQRP